jgi:hypothetical protein
MFVGGVPRETTEVELRGAFALVGVDVGNIELVRNRVTGLPRGFAFIRLCPGGADAKADTLALRRLRTATLDGAPFSIQGVPELPLRAC